MRPSAPLARLFSLALSAAALVAVGACSKDGPDGSTLVGCFVDQGDPTPSVEGHDLDGEAIMLPRMTLDICIGRCSQKNFAYAGVQKGNQCFCGKSYGKFGKAPDADCKTPCDGSSTQICGGTSRNTVYKLLAP
jgi:hypothetical protein